MVLAVLKVLRCGYSTYPNYTRKLADLILNELKGIIALFWCDMLLLRPYSCSPRCFCLGTDLKDLCHLSLVSH